jgi:hypothetical protein
MFEQRREEQPEGSRKQAPTHLSFSLGVPADTIRGWADRFRVEAGEKPGKRGPAPRSMHRPSITKTLQGITLAPANNRRG